MQTLTATDARALTAPWTVVSDAPEAGDDPHCHAVVTPTGTVVVDRRRGTCSCDGDDSGGDTGARACAHRRRVAFAVGAAVIPRWADLDALAPDFGDHAAGDALVAGAGPAPRRLDLVRDGASALNRTERIVWRARTRRRSPAAGQQERRS